MNVSFSVNGFGQFYGDKIEKIKVEKLLILPLNGSYVFVDTKTPAVDLESTRDVNKILNKVLDSVLNVKMETVRFPANTIIDSLIQTETLKSGKTIFNNKTIKGMHIPRTVDMLMKKTKSDYALSVTYEYWDRSEDNIKRINNKKRKQVLINSIGYAAFGLIANHASPGKVYNTTSYDITDSYILWTIYDKKRNNVVSFYHKTFDKGVEYMPELLAKMYNKCFPDPKIVYTEEGD